MKKQKIFIFLLLLVCTVCSGQRSGDVIARRLDVKDSLRLRGTWYKNFPNLATAPLTATGNYSHNWNQKNFIIDNTGWVQVASYIGSPMLFTSNHLNNGVQYVNRFGITSGSYETFMFATRASQTASIQLNSFRTLIASTALHLKVANHNTAAVNSLLVLDTPSSGAVKWINPASLTLNSWSVYGNAGPYSADMLLGTTNNFPFKIVSNSFVRMHFDPAGPIGVNTQTPVNGFDIMTGLGLKFVVLELTENLVIPASNPATVFRLRNETSGNKVVTLPAPSNVPNRVFIISRESTDAIGEIYLTENQEGGIEDGDGSLVISTTLLQTSRLIIQSTGDRYIRLL